MTRTNRFVSFLDRFEEQLVVDCVNLKHELLDRVDHQFGLMRTKVRELKNRFGARGGDVGARSGYADKLTDDPAVETVSLGEWLREQRISIDEQKEDMSSTSSGRKRASLYQAHSTPKKRKSTPNNINQTKKYVCKFEGCGLSFGKDSKLKSHEFIHLGIKPFSCTWPNCEYSSETRGNVVRHVRMKHFNLPMSQKEQRRRNIVADRDPNEFVQVDTQLVERRLE